jgi:anti-sigma regulatory factor (Ser/Thr protein kinase)/AmiR/NasT family two-component response regulator
MGRLLVVRPDAALKRALAHDPGLRNHYVEFCDGTVEAIRLVRDRAVDVLVTDPTTSGKDDVAIAEEVRKARASTKIIALAPEVSQEDLVNALRAHVFAVFTPPLDYGEVVGMARAALDDVNWRDGIEVVTALAERMTLRVSCHLLTADRLVRFMTEHEQSLPPGERDLLLTAFREMLVNAMEHGAGFDPAKVIEVTAARTERAIVYHFRDPGSGFDRIGLSHAASSSTAEDVMDSAIRRAEMGLRPGGFGMLIVRQIVDEVVYNELGNEVLLIKHLK